MEESELLRQWKEKIKTLRAMGVDLFPNDFRAEHTSGAIIERYGDWSAEALADLKETMSCAGRIMAIRDFGKAAFVHLQDRKGRIQVYVRRDLLGEEPFGLFKRLDAGDFLGVQGRLFRTKTGELTIEASSIQLLAKSCHPLPEKWHGLIDVEARYRQRYLDLIVNPKVKETFYKRNEIIQGMKGFLLQRDFLEVETPMMQPIPGGAQARPFKTHHNALNMDLYLRIAPELYLKRLVIGGLERVFELNRNFRNEGVSSQHNPEFTMLEFYQSYSTYEDLMALIEEMIGEVAEQVLGSHQITYQGAALDLTPPWPRITLKESLIQYGVISRKELETVQGGTGLEKILEEIKIKKEKELNIEEIGSLSGGEFLVKLFEEVVEPKLIQPTFITEYPVEVSPLARRKGGDQTVTERFELFIMGREIANGFSELNDPEDQRERFRAQAAHKGAAEDDLSIIDEAFLTALEYGMPPTAGAGIGIDRLVMILTDSPSIRDVIFFPQMREKA
ncbi:MAG: lysine--tRNA ligase [Deltaproteobacteria bacterium RBG_13_52_11]|nr:MAG: lysine--tRNA ligase [Deltaproteobacteria bacterium RBG_13_52_11]